jgi:hypothetical protein
MVGTRKGIYMSDFSTMSMNDLVDGLNEEIENQMKIENIYLRGARLDEEYKISKEKEKMFRLYIAIKVNQS